MPDSIRVLVVDDHAVVRRGLKLFLDLQEDIAVVGEAVDGGDALEQAGTLRPDVIVMDLVMPKMDGIEATRAVAETCPETKVLVLSSFGDEERVVPVLRAGAAGYLMKNSEPEQLAQAIRTVHAGGSILCTEAAQRVLGQLARARPRPEGTVTILFSDIEGSTALVEARGDEGARALFREHDLLLRAVLEEHGGLEVEREGDAFMFAFAGARQAILCAIDMQRALERRARERPEEAVRVRIGINTGEVIAEEQGYFGKAVFLAARVAAKARGGQILVTETTRALAEQDGVRFLSRGRHELKGLSGKHELHEVAWRDEG